MMSKKHHTGDTFIGGLLADGYIPLMGCKTDVEITATYTDLVTEPFNAEGGAFHNISIGGVCGLAVGLYGCEASGDIRFTDESNLGNVNLLCEGAYGSVLAENGEVTFTGTVV